jgi:hypothetical protein
MGTAGGEAIQLVRGSHAGQALGAIAPKEQTLWDHRHAMSLGVHSEQQVVIFGPAVVLISKRIQ